MNLKEAKKLYFAYDGSSFGMTRECVLDQYREAKVPPEVEAAWLEELTRDKLRLLSRRGDFMPLHFLMDHGNLGHLAEAVQAVPQGPRSSQCAFFGLLLDYANRVKRAGGDPSLVARAARKAIAAAEPMLRRAKAKEPIDRIQGILDRARRLLDEVEAGGGSSGAVKKTTYMKSEGPPGVGPGSRSTRKR